MSYFGDIALGDTVDIKFSTRRFSTGSPFTLAGSPAIVAYPGNSTTEITAGITLTVDFDAITGLHNIRVVATSGNGYATATNYALVLSAGTVDSVSVVGEVVASFSIEARSALRPTVAARTLDVSTGGEAGIDWANVGTPGSTVGLSATTVATVTTTTTATNVTTVNGLAANVITATSIAADAITDAKVASDVTIASVTGSVGSVTGAVGSVTGSVGSVASGGITATSIAADAIGASELASDALAEIADAVLDEVIEGSTTLRQVLRGFAAALLSKASGLATTTAVYRDVGDTKDRITATVDASGNRSAVTLDLT